MSTRNIFYTSNSHSNIFPKNARSNFSCQIDVNEFSYLHPNNLSVAIKSITFENKFNTISNEYGKPHIILIQEYDLSSLSLKYDGIWRSESRPESFVEVDIQSGKDYYFMSNPKASYAEGKNFEIDNFTDIKMFCEIRNSHNKSEVLNHFIVHNIYLHENNFSTNKEFLTYLNHVYENIEFDIYKNVNYDFARKPKKDKPKLFKLDSNNKIQFYNKERPNISIFLSSVLSERLGFTRLDLHHVNYKNQKDILTTYFKGIEPKNDDEYLYLSEELQTFSDNVFINSYLNIKFTKNDIYCNFFKNNDDYTKASNEINLMKAQPVILGL